MNLDRFGELPGRRVVAASWGGTALFAVTAVPAATGVDAFEVPAAAVGLVLFVVSIPLSLVALARAAVRIARQEDRITVGGLFFLQGAPKPVRRLLLGSLLASLAVVVATITTAPFGVLQPVFPLALCAWWAARHGTFPRIPNP